MSALLPSAVLFVADVPALSRFYREVAALQVVQQDDDHVLLEGGGFQLVVHALRGEPDPSRDAQGRTIVRELTYIKFCLPVQSLAAARERAAAEGGFLKPASAEWEARGARAFRACDGHDAEGNVFQLREALGAS